MDKDFTDEFYRIFELYKQNDSFLFGKAADGELMAVENHILNNNEFRNDESVPAERREELKASLQFRHPNFYLGIICPCCSNYDGRFERMKKLVNQDEDHLTYANIFVNSNYPLYRQFFIPSFSQHDVWLVCHEDSILFDLPFHTERVFVIKRNAWVDSYDVIQRIQDAAPEGKLLLFAAGPFGNILGHKLFQSHPKNRMLDIGSTLNPWLQSEGFRRDYYTCPESGFGARKCVWN